MTKTIADIMVETLGAAGIERIYGLVGNSLIGLMPLHPAIVPTDDAVERLAEFLNGASRATLL